MQISRVLATRSKTAVRIDARARAADSEEVIAQTVTPLSTWIHCDSRIVAQGAQRSFAGRPLDGANRSGRYLLWSAALGGNAR